MIYPDRDQSHLNTKKANNNMKNQRIIISSGEPAGIGPDLCVQLSQFAHPCEIIVLADPELLKQRAKQLKLELDIHPCTAERSDLTHQKGHLNVLPINLVEPAVSGRLNVKNSRYVLDMIRLATEQCVAGNFDAMVTAPVHKGVIYESGLNFTGHTEYIAAITGGYPVMMLTASGLRVALATTHLPLTKISAAITRESLQQVILILYQSLQKYFNIKKPTIMVCGLNPHAGEHGYLGREEIEVIEPVILHLQTQGMDLHGPLPADTVYTTKYLEQADAVLAMYHDQGLPVLKHMSFGKAANVTLGLPIIRTSVDHGTALDLAGTGRIDNGSLQYAIQTALEMASNI